MQKQTKHSATITLKLPLDLSLRDEIAALRAAGIPVDSLGNAQFGFLFIRTGGNSQNRKNTFRWFASSIQ